MKCSKMVILWLFLLLIFFTTLNMLCATDITINNTNNTLKNVMNSYDTIYLDDGIYNGSNNRNITVSKNTTIIGLHKGLAIIEPGSDKLFIVDNASLTLINLTIRNGEGYSAINNFGLLNISNTNFENNGHLSTIYSTRNLIITDSSFKNGFIAVSSVGSYNLTIKNTEFINNKLRDYGVIHALGQGKVVYLDNLTFVNNTSNDNLISIIGNNISLKLSNSSFINNTVGSSDFIYMYGTFGPPTIPNKKDLKNIVEVGTKVNINPRIGFSVFLKKNNLIVFKANLTKFREVFSNKRLYFYVDGKLVGSALTDKNGVATFSYKRSNLNFTLQVVFNKLTDKTSTKTINYDGTSFKGSASNYVVGESKIVLKLKNVKNKGQLIYKKYNIYNKGDSFGSKTFNKKISSKYKLVKYSYKNVGFKYNKSKKSFSVKVKNLLPYKFNKKNLGVLILVLKKK